MQTQTITQRIGNFIREMKERKADSSAVIQVLKANGYEDRKDTCSDEKDVTVFGNQREYRVKHQFGTPFVSEAQGRYALVPVRTIDEYSGSESEELVLVDRASKKTAVAVSAGERGVHYEGRCRLVPLVLDVKDGKAIIAYKDILHADLKTPLKVSRSVFEDYLFRNSENCVTQVDLRKLGAKE